MLHFPSSGYHSPNPNSKAGALPSRTDSLKLNATQQKAASHQIFTTIEEELHDARRVHSHGQEEDLRAALGMVVERLGEISTMLSDVYKSNAELEVQLNVAKSNLALVIANNEMLEDALKQRDSTTQNVGWRRTSGRAYSTDDALQAMSPHPGTGAGDNTPTATPIDSPAPDSNRFFKFRFTPGNSASRPGTPGASPAIPHLNSPSLPALSTVKEKERDRDREKELEKELEKERKAREEAKKEKEALEEELESLSQALFEEANKMVATERIRRADVEEELKEAKLEKEALRSALRLLEGQTSSSSNSPALPASVPASLSTSSSNDSIASTSSPTLTLSPTTITEKDKEPTSLDIPPSISGTSTAIDTKRTRIPPPAPLSVPTTPFDYDATFDTTSATPTARQSLEEKVPPTEEGNKLDKGDTKKDWVEVVAEPEVEKESTESTPLGEANAEIIKSEETTTNPPFQPSQAPENSSQSASHSQAAAASTTPENISSNPPGNGVEGEENDASASTASPPPTPPPSASLRLPPLTLEQDPWADAVPSMGMIGALAK